MEGAVDSKPRLFFEVEKVIDISSDGNYQVQWAPAWVSKFQLAGCEHLIREFHEQQKGEKENESEQLLQVEHAMSVLSNAPSKQTKRKPLQYENTTTETDSTDMQVHCGVNENHGDTNHKNKGISMAETEDEGNVSDDVDSIDIGSSDDDFFNETDSETASVRMEKGTTTTTTVGDAPSHGNRTSPLVFHMVCEDNSTQENDLKPKKTTVVKRTKVQRKRGKMKEEGDTKPHICPVCSREFPHKSGLSMHFRSHSGFKPYVCQHCSASFARNSNLTRHLLTNHSAAKPLQCGYCGKGFTRKDDMERHVRVHTGDRPFTCHICDKSFTIRSSLTQHLRVHSGERPYVCEICGDAFAATYQYNKHVKNCSSATMIVSQNL